MLDYIVRRKMGECLVQAGLITAEGLRKALNEQKRTGERLGIVLTRLGLATETGIARALAVQLGFPYVDLSEQPPDPRAVSMIPRAKALKHTAVGIRLDKGILTVAMSDPLLLGLAQDLERDTGLAVQQVVATRTDILAAIVGADRPAGGRAAAADEIATDSAPAAAAGTVSQDLLRSILSDAVANGAADVHIEPTAEGTSVRNRVDGVLRQGALLPLQDADRLIAMVKQMAGMETAEARLPQDGRLRYEAANEPAVEFRVSTLRTLFGEKLVLRRWDRPAAALPIDQLGLSASMLDEARGFVAHRRGLVLVCGTIGSGARTTMAALAADAAAARAGSDVVTIEDPIAYRIPGVTQTDVDAGESFSGRLQALLEERPDVVVVGVLGDGETARVACQAAVSALVITSVRADDLPAATAALIALGVEPRAIAASLVGAISQRLVRRLCPSCRTALPEDPSALEDVFLTPAGCEQCHHTGYRGRVGIFQTIVISGEVRQAIADGGHEDRVIAAIRRGEGVTLGEDALAKARTGLTSIEEVQKTIGAAETEPRPLCTTCGAVSDPGFLACPACGASLGSACEHCGRSLEAGWRFCPYCARRATPRGPGRDGNRGRGRVVLS